MKEYIDNLTKENEYLKKVIELKKEIYGQYASVYKEEDTIERNKLLIDLLERIASIPKENFIIPSKILHPIFRMNDTEIFIEFSIDEKVFNSLYKNFISSYSSLYSEMSKIIKELFFQIAHDLPHWDTKLTTSVSDFKRNCDYFYDEAIRFLKALQEDEYAKVVLDTIDNMYLKFIEISKKEAEE